MLDIQFEDTTKIKNLKLLFWLRWLTIVIQLSIILLVEYGLAIKLPLMPMLSIVLALVVVNITTYFRIQTKNITIHTHEILAHIIVDVLALALLVYYSGGSSNPFANFFLMHVVIAAILLKPVFTWLIVMLTIGLYLLLTHFNFPLMHEHYEMSKAFNLHVYGMVLGYVIAAILVTAFVVRMAGNLRQRDLALYELKQQAAAETQAVRLGMLAAGAAHELGTPLNTIAMVCDELTAEETQQNKLEHLKILQRQVIRCKNSLQDLMLVAGKDQALNANQQACKDFIQMAAEQWQQSHPDIQFEFEFLGDEHAEMVADKLITQAIYNVLDNAAKVSPQSVKLLAQCSENNLQLSIVDCGPGMDENIIANIGKDSLHVTEKSHQGIGLFLVKTLMQRMGGELLFEANQPQGTIVIIKIPK